MGRWRWVQFQDWGKARQLVGPCVVLTAFLSLGGCASTNGAPQRLYPVGYETGLIRDQFGPIDRNAYFALAEPDRVAYRNELIGARLYAIDLHYTEFEQSLTRERQRVGFIATTTSLGLSTAATGLDPSTTTRILSGAAAFVTGTRSAYNDEILLAKTIQIIQSQMRASRADIAARIIYKMRLSSAAYPLSLALSDIEEYYRAGTVTGGVVDATETVARQVDIAEANKEAVEINVNVRIDEASEALDRYLSPDGIDNEARIEQVYALLRSRGITARLGFVLVDASMAAVRRNIARELGLIR